MKKELSMTARAIREREWRANHPDLLKAKNDRRRKRYKEDSEYRSKVKASVHGTYIKDPKTKIEQVNKWRADNKTGNRKYMKRYMRERRAKGIK